jgi:hypothetical protein
LERFALPRPNWWQPLSRPIIIPDLLELTTLADVRELIDKHLPAEYRAKFTWRQLAGLLKRVAEGQQESGRGFDLAAYRAAARGDQNRDRRRRARQALRARGVDEPPHHVRPHGRQGELCPLLFREIQDTVAELLEYAAIVREAFHRADLDHRPIVAKLAADRAATQVSDVVRFHRHPPVPFDDSMRLANEGRIQMSRLLKATFVVCGLLLFAVLVSLAALPFLDLNGRPKCDCQQQTSSSSATWNMSEVEPKGTPNTPFFVQIIPRTDSAQRTPREAEDQAEKQAADRALVQWTAALFSATLGLFVATGVLGYFAYRQLQDNDRALKITNRAYLVVEPDGLIPPFGEFEGHVVIGHIQIRNVGHVIARNVNWFKTIGLSPEGKKTDFPIRKEDFEGNNAVLPETAMTQGTSQVQLAPEGFIYVWGEVRYDDGFGQQRFTRFCHRYNRRSLTKMENRSTHHIAADLARFHEYGNEAD